MNIIIKILNLLILILSYTAWAGYMLVTSDVPPLVTSAELKIFIMVYLIIMVITIFDFIVCIKYKYRGGYFALFFELIILFIWIFSYVGIWKTDYRIITIVSGGILTSATQVITQLINIIKSRL